MIIDHPVFAGFSESFILVFALGFHCALPSWFVQGLLSTLSGWRGGWLGVDYVWGHEGSHAQSHRRTCRQSYLQVGFLLDIIQWCFRLTPGRTRRRIIRNNEKLAHASSSADAATTMPEPPRDQSFTRPKALLLFPLRSLALHYVTTHLFPLAPPGTQIENLRPFTTSFSLPPEAGEDPLVSPAARSSFPTDHLVNFQGNSDDSFRIGIKITRKAWRVVLMPANEAKLMECDILIASPLGFKMAAEKEDSTDLLSSIEICVADGMDVMQMQNWDHVQVS